LLKFLLLAALAFLSICSFVNAVLANPIPWDYDPWDSLRNGNPAEYFSIITAEFCGLVVGTAILTYNRQTQWQKATVTVLIALITSYIIGITIWTLGYRTGILVYNPVNPHPSSLIILLLPEFIGTIIGSIIIRTGQKVEWKTALITMTAAMLTSFLVGILLVNIYLHLI